MEAEKARLVEENLNLVHHTINTHFNNLRGDEDVFQIGCIGLMQAANKFDASRGLSFSTIAVPCIRGPISNYLRDLNANKRVALKHSVSLQVIVAGKSEGKERTLEDLIQDAFNLEDSICDKLLIQEVLSKSSITDRQKQCFFNYHIQGIDQNQLAKILGVSQVQVSREITRATKKIRTAIA